MGSDTLTRTNILKEPKVHPILSLEVKTIDLDANLKEGARLQG